GNTKAAEIDTLHQDYVTKLDALDKQLDSLVVEPDWDKLYEQDPKGARELQKQYDTFKAQRGAITAERERVNREAAERSLHEKAEFGKKELAKFVSANPEWKTPQDMNKELASMHRTASELGFSQEEIADVLDSRMLRVL